MNRRHFLKAFTGAAVGAGVLIVAPKVIASPNADWFGTSPIESAWEIQQQMKEMLKLLDQRFYDFTIRVQPKTDDPAQIKAAEAAEAVYRHFMLGDFLR